MTELPAVRVSDADRDRVVALLREHLVAGRLTLEEFSERIDEAYAARTRAELDVVTRELPDTGAPERPRRKATRWTIAVMGAAARRGRWRVPERTAVVALMGGAQLDLSEAEIADPDVRITAVAAMGGIDIRVPEGVEVELTGFALMGGRDDRTADVPTRPGAPFVRVRAFALMGGVNVRSKPRRRKQLHAG